jgi:hypothetical protein
MIGFKRLHGRIYNRSYVYIEDRRERNYAANAKRTANKRQKYIVHGKKKEMSIFLFVI